MSAHRLGPVALALASMLVLGACDKSTSPPDSSGEPQPSESQPSEPSDGDGRSSTGTKQDRRTPPARTPKSEPADPFADGFVAAHNQVRSSVSPAAEPALPPVSWSPELAKQAQAWAQRCQFDHSDTDLGENLSARTDLAEPDEIVAAWAAEREGFDHAKNRCANGKVCGHYTQVVWRDSTQIGCGMAQCGAGGPFGDSAWVMWVCQYSPAGNWKGQRPY